jgi:hypothetical protein
MLLTTNHQHNSIFKELNANTAAAFGLNIVAAAPGCIDGINHACDVKHVSFKGEVWLLWRLLSFLVTCN